LINGVSLPLRQMYNPLLSSEPAYNSQSGLDKHAAVNLVFEGLIVSSNIKIN